MLAEDSNLSPKRNCAGPSSGPSGESPPDDGSDIWSVDWSDEDIWTLFSWTVIRLIALKNKLQIATLKDRGAGTVVARLSGEWEVLGLIPDAYKLFFLKNPPVFKPFVVCALRKRMECREKCSTYVPRLKNILGNKNMQFLDALASQLWWTPMYAYYRGLLILKYQQLRLWIAMAYGNSLIIKPNWAF